MPMSRTQTGGQLLFEDYNVGDRAIVGPSRALARDICVCDDMNLMPQVIEGQQAIEEHQHTIRQRKIVLGVFTDSFQLANRVISEITNCAGGERWQPGDCRRAMLPEQL